MTDEQYEEIEMTYCNKHETEYSEDVGCPKCITAAGLAFIEDRNNKQPLGKAVVDEFMGMLKALERR